MGRGWQLSPQGSWDALETQVYWIACLRWRLLGAVVQPWLYPFVGCLRSFSSSSPFISCNHSHTYLFSLYTISNAHHSPHFRPIVAESLVLLHKGVHQQHTRCVLTLSRIVTDVFPAYPSYMAGFARPFASAPEPASFAFEIWTLTSFSTTTKTFALSSFLPGSAQGFDHHTPRTLGLAKRNRTPLPDFEPELFVPDF